MEISPFRDRKEHELYDLSDEDLIAYVRAAAAAGRIDAAQPAIGVLVFAYLGAVTQRVRLRVPTADVDDVAAIAIEGAAAAAFDGRSVGEFRSWLHTITDRRIADYHRKRANKPSHDPLPTEHLGVEEVWGDEPAIEFAGTAEDAHRALALAFDELRIEHQEVVRRYVLGRGSATAVAAGLEGMTEANVHQIASRFQRRVEQLLEGSDTSP